MIVYRHGEVAVRLDVDPVAGRLRFVERPGREIVRVERLLPEGFQHRHGLLDRIPVERQVLPIDRLSGGDSRAHSQMVGVTDE